MKLANEYSIGWYVSEDGNYFRLINTVYKGAIVYVTYWLLEGGEKIDGL